MALTPPSFDAFEAGWTAGKNQVVYTRLAADLDTPVSLMMKLTEARKDSFMLESVTGGEVRGRYSIVGMKPDLIWECRGGEDSRINRQARFDPDGFEPMDGHPLDTLRQVLAESEIDLPDDLPGAAAGLFGYLGYDMIRLVEHLPNVNPPDPLDLPDALMLRPPSVVAVLDGGVKGEVTLVAPPAFVSSGLSAKAAYAQAAERVMDALRDLERAATGESAIWARRWSWANRCQTLPSRTTWQRSKRPRTTSVRATSFRWCPASAGPRISPPCPPLRALPVAQAHQPPLALHVLFQLRRLPGDRRKPPRNSGAGLRP